MTEAQRTIQERTTQHQRIGTELVLAKRYDDAEREYLAALRLDPRQTEIATDLALVYFLQQRYEEVERTLKGVLETKPDTYIAQSNLGYLYLLQRRYQEAKTVLQALLHRQPQMLDAQKSLGLVLMSLELYEEAITLYQSSLQQNPQEPELHFKLADAYMKLQRFPDAEVILRKAVLLQTRQVDSFVHLANLLNIQGRFKESDEALLRAHALVPRDAETYAIGSTCASLRGEIQEAILLIRKAIGLNPDNSRLHKQHGMLLLLTGQMEAGWREFEYRRDSAKDRKCLTPRWEGESLKGKKILVLCEQGKGDMIQCVRFLPLLKASGAFEVILECYPELMELFRKVPGVDRIVIQDPLKMPFESFDYQVRMMSLAYLFQEDATFYAASVPYLQPDLARLSDWQQRLANLPGCKVGIVWAGDSKYDGDWNRSCNLEQFLPLLSIPNVTPVSLQKGRASQMIQSLGLNMKILNLDAELQDYSDTAAAISQMDLVISVDTSVAHLAGALGCPTWTLLPYSSEWRWQLDRNDSPWYPTMRLFRQPGFRDWESVFMQLQTSLLDFTDQIW